MRGSIKNILVVEDSRTGADVIVAALEPLDYQIQVAGSAEEGIEAIGRSIPDLIISDIILPGMDGYDFCRKVRERAETRLTPFIFLSCKDQVDEKVEGLQSGADDYLTKPFAPAELIARVSASLTKMEILLNLSNIDGLTGIYNRKHFDERLAQEFKRHSRRDLPFSMVLIDIDNYKEINDTYGHLTGDIVLQEMARFLRMELREQDIIARYGGDEFAVVFPETDKEGAVAVLTRMANEISRRPFPGAGGETVPKVTVSAGVSSYPRDGLSPEELVSKADEALYRAKRGGRDQVCG
ncbi:MAG: diguanylate cyclase [Nitrospirota bacterium]|nr:diguanylate cyclase [Nitrospirota bacterium]